ncbi:MAG: alpha-hydroxy acid oxidase [Acidimicrobiales bacterium]|jgi:L-lactate dehydrogenase (cytochrome)
MKLAEVRELVQLRPPVLSPVERVLARCHSVEDLRQAARRKLPRAVFDYVEGGADAEHTISTNRAGFDRWAFQPRSLRDVSAPDLSVELFGQLLAAPLGLAPTGYTRMMHPSGETAVAQASAVRALPYCLSTVGTTSIEDLAATGHPRLWFQLYVLKDRGHTRSLLERAAAAGYEALEVSVDTAVPGNRARDVRNGLTIPPQLSARTIIDIGLHPGYWAGMLASPMLSFANLVGGPDEAGGAMPRGSRHRTVEDMTAMFDPSLDWDDLDRLRGWWRGPMLIKGPISPADAVRAIGAGIDGVHLSNHGGRQLDRTVATIDLVRPVREAVQDKAVIVVDSGVRHGADVAVALARGADICMVGRPYLYGLAAAGTAGARRAIDMLVEQFRRTLQLLGVTSVPELRQHADTLVVSQRDIGAGAARSAQERR